MSTLNTQVVEVLEDYVDACERLHAESRLNGTASFSITPSEYADRIIAIVRDDEKRALCALGHSFEHVVNGGGEPQTIVCANCGKSWPVKELVE